MLTGDQIKIFQNRLAGSSELIDFFKALSEESRFLIFLLLIQRKQEKRGDICVTDIANILNLSLSSASKHLKELENAGLVEKTRCGQMICYQQSGSKPVKRLVGLILNFTS